VAIDLDGGVVLASAQGALPAPQRGPGGVSSQRSAYASTALSLLAEVCGRLGERRREMAAVSVTGTSGTVVPCDRLGAAVGDARLYDDASTTAWLADHGVSGAPALGRVAALLDVTGAERYASTADVVAAALVGGPVASDTSHTLKAGIDPSAGTWPEAALTALGIPRGVLPDLVPPCTALGLVTRELARGLGIPGSTVVAAGMTDGCTAQVSTGGVRPGDTVGVLGTTLVLKAVSRDRLETPDGAVYSHRAPDGLWWAGGASNTGGGVLADEFPGADLSALDRRVADRPGRVVRYPLVRAGERFPVNDPRLLPLRSGEPGTREDAYRAVLEGVAFVERLGLERLAALEPPDADGRLQRRHLLAGGATASAVWNRIRATVLAPLTPVSVSAAAAAGSAAAGSTGSAVGAAILAAHSVADAATPFSDTVARLVPAPVPLTPDRRQSEPLAHAYRQFLDLLASATSATPLLGAPRA
jgi:xylulokinase